VLLGAEGEGVDIDTGIGVAGVVLEGLDNIEVVALTLREAVLAVKLELGSDDGVLAPAVHVKGSLGEHEGAGIGDEGALVNTALGTEGYIIIGTRGGIPLSSICNIRIISTGHLEKTRCVDETVLASGLLGSTESMDGVGEGINAVSVVEGLGTKSTVEDTTGIKGGAVVDVGIRLHNPDKLLARMVEIELDLVTGASDRLVAGELNLFDQIFMRVLCHLAALVSVKEDVIDVKGSSDE